MARKNAARDRALEELRRENIEKGKEYESFWSRYLKGTFAILGVVLIIAFFNFGNFFDKSYLPVLLLLSTFIMPAVSFFHWIGTNPKCPNCEAFGDIIDVESELLSEKHIGRDVKVKEKAFRGPLDSSNYDTIVTHTYRRTYDNYHTCNCCEYQWVERETKTEKERE